MMSSLKMLFSLALCAGLFGNFANAQDGFSREDALREEGLDWLLPFSECTSDLLPETWVDLDYDRRACEDHLSACVANCESGDASQCFIAALTHQSLGNDAHGDGLFQRACKLGGAAGCTNLAATYRANGLSDEVCIANTFFGACDGGDAWACTMSGVVLWDGEGVETDRQRAKSYFDQSCTIDPDFAACDFAKEVVAEAEEAVDE
jgi:hypothetical protein